MLTLLFWFFLFIFPLSQYVNTVELDIGLAFCQGLAFDLCMSALMVKKWKQHRCCSSEFVCLSPLADTHTVRAFSAKYSRSGVMASFSQTVLNQIFDKNWQDRWNPFWQRLAGQVKLKVHVRHHWFFHNQTIKEETKNKHTCQFVSHSCRIWHTQVYTPCYWGKTYYHGVSNRSIDNLSYFNYFWYRDFFFFFARQL